MSSSCLTNEDIRGSIDQIQSELTEFKDDVNHRFDDVNHRLDDVNNRLDDFARRFDELKAESLRNTAYMRNTALRNPKYPIRPLIAILHNDIVEPDPARFPRHADDFYALRKPTTDHQRRILAYLAEFYDIPYIHHNSSFDSDSDNDDRDPIVIHNPGETVDFLESVLGPREDNFKEFRQRARELATRSPPPPVKRSQLQPPQQLQHLRRPKFDPQASSNQHETDITPHRAAMSDHSGWTDNARLEWGSRSTPSSQRPTHDKSEHKHRGRSRRLAFRSWDVLSVLLCSQGPFLEFEQAQIAFNGHRFAMMKAEDSAKGQQADSDAAVVKVPSRVYLVDATPAFHTYWGISKFTSISRLHCIQKCGGSLGPRDSGGIGNSKNNRILEVSSGWDDFDPPKLSRRNATRTYPQILKHNTEIGATTKRVEASTAKLQAGEVLSPKLRRTKSTRSEEAGNEQPTTFHVDFTDDEIETVKSFLRTLGSIPLTLEQIRNSPRRVELAPRLTKILRSRRVEDTHDFLEDLPEFDEVRPQCQLSLVRDEALDQQRRRDRRLNTLRLAREMNGSFGFGATMSQQNLETEVLKDLSDSIDHKIARFGQCSGDVATMA
ncbi:hypothetical protein LIA77_04074 [Sarocladium implicatum]|nr:hypothetical protein LIA77_04074 [Sarocladium implicatum]